MFLWTEKDLNGDQVDAIEEDGNVLLIACPGSGKTRTLTYKIALELSKLSSSKKYLIAITYTNRAAEEIKDRIEHLGVNTDQLWIGTIHAFCLEWILRPYANKLTNLKFGFRVINAHESEAIFSTLCAPYAAKKITPFNCQYYMKSNVYVLQNPKISIASEVDTILKQYWAHLLANNQIDFELILYYSHTLLKQHNYIAKTLSKIFTYILVDEFQDTREIQYKILSLIISEAKDSIKSFIVGDPNQAIYTSLGGYPISKTELESITGQTFIERTLSKNYRSSEKVIAYFDHYKTYTNTIVACGHDKEYASLITFNNQVERPQLEDEIARLILLNINDKQIVPNEICVIAPQWVHLASLTRTLMIKLPDYSFNGPGMAPFVRDIDNFFFKLCRIALTEPSPQLYTSRLRWSKEILYELTNLGVPVGHLSPKLFLKLCNSLAIDEPEGIPYLKTIFKKVFDEIGFDFNIIASLAEHHESFFKSSEDRIARLVKEGYPAITTTENFKKVFKQRDGITVSTIHGVKGAEFNTVIAFALLQGYVPHNGDSDGENSANKLLYVISSRAKKNLHLISERKRFLPYGSPPNEYDTTERLRQYRYAYDPN